ncbi:MAG: hypothetical protein RIB45_15485 [Marivibrio sp.]|uniref:hypothetical protein n=1 Tax=Marivibrio sp. TaxID=2039719 RepID=UPI0032F02B45
MSDFTQDWLSLRAAADERAREAADLDGQVIETLGRRGGETLRVVDLGAGQGNNLRYLAPRLDRGLGRPQAWTLVDSDGALLAAAEAPASPGMRLATQRCDLAADLSAAPLAEADLITASALFDLVSAAWTQRFAEACAAARVPCGLFALTVDGRLDWSPEVPEDDEVAQLFLQHLQGDKGFGPALGADAPQALADAFEAVGYEVERRDSAWRLDPRDADLQRALVEGYREAAQELAPARAAEIDAWAEQRLHHIGAGLSAHTVGHEDLLAIRRAD